MALLGNLILHLLFLMAILAGAMAIVSIRKRSQAYALLSVRIMTSVAYMAAACFCILLYAFSVPDLRLIYVQQHVERAMPMFYRLTALWGGMEGSMLLWVTALCVVSAIAVRKERYRLPRMIPYVVLTLVSVIIFFDGIMLISANPFATFLANVPVSGKGLNPLLQNPYMVTHPPSLYMGFVTLTVPFAFAIGAMGSGELDSRWLEAARPWALLGWFFLSLGLTLGMLWAYEELGWGGYWGWDPVENAGFMPWLLVSAFLHSLMVQERRGMLKVWNIILATLAFVMTIFGTFLTRSGFIDSVHAFARSNVGYVFLGFIAVVLVISFALIYWRRLPLRSTNELESIWSREFWFLLNNWVLLSACFLVLTLTIFPTISEAFDEKITISIAAFNKWMVPLGVALLLITGIGPMLGWRRTSVSGLKHQFAWPMISLATVLVVLSFLGIRQPWALITWALAALVIHGIFQEVYRTVVMRRRVSGLSLAASIVKLFQTNARRYGGYIVHLGIVLMCIGFAGEAFKRDTEVVMTPGQDVRIGQYRLVYEGVTHTQDDNKRMLTANLRAQNVGAQDLLPAARKDKGPSKLLQPARWIYHKHRDSPTTEVAMWRTLKNDLFIAIGRCDPKDKSCSFRIVINPLVNWIWIGFFFLSFGVAIAGIPFGRFFSRIGAVAPVTSRVSSLMFFAFLSASTLMISSAYVVVHAKRQSNDIASNSPNSTAEQDHNTEHLKHKHEHGTATVLTANNPREQFLFSHITCQCGTCPKLPLDKCGCEFARREREAIRKKASEGLTDDEIFAWYTAERGGELGQEPFEKRALAIPPDVGFTRLYWILPYVFSTLAMIALLIFGMRFKKRSATTLSGDDHDRVEQPVITDPDAYDALLDREIGDV